MNRTSKLITAILGIILLIAGGSIFFLNNSVIRLNRKASCKPTFADGDGPYYLPNAPFRDSLAPTNNHGQPLVVSGTLLQNDCLTPISDAVIDIWQANEDGVYVDDWYRGKIRTDAQGKYQFESVMPKGYGEGTAHRPPHIHVKIYLKDQLIITSEMFFPEVKGTPGFDDAYIMTTTIKKKDGVETIYGNHDLVLP